MRSRAWLTVTTVCTIALTISTFATVTTANSVSKGDSTRAHQAQSPSRSDARQKSTSTGHASRRSAEGSASSVRNDQRASARRAGSKWKPRGEAYPKTITIQNLLIPMDDGVVLRADLMLPADAAGNAIHAKFPVVATITAYNKVAKTLVGGNPPYLVKRGYAHLTVDARGTGASEGEWCGLCTREDKDFSEVMQWAHTQAWSDGKTAMDGASYMGIAQMFAAAGHPPGLKAIFPQVPAADIYRDVVASGGQLDVGFIPFWLSLVTATSLIPPATPATDLGPLSVLAHHLVGPRAFALPLLLSALGGKDAAYDGPFYQQRSPINVVSKVDVPTFFVSGESDLFQRGTPLLFENLQRRGVPTKIIIGPWNHVQASQDGVEEAGLGSIDQLKLRWFDHYVKGIPDPGLNSDIAPITYYEQGTGAWRRSSVWLGDRRAVTYRLSGQSRTAGADGALTTGAATTGTSTVYPIPVAGICTRSTDQWTAGLSSYLPGKNPCFTNNKANDTTGVVFKTAPLTKPVALQGPVAARLYLSSTSGDGMLSVALEDEAPDGAVTRLTGGWQVISQRALDKSRSRYLDGKLIQPYHPFTRAAKVVLSKGSVAAIDVELFPTGAKLLPGHRLRIAVQTFDIPHLAPTLPDLLSTLGVITIHNSARYPSSVTIPVRTN